MLKYTYRKYQRLSIALWLILLCSSCQDILEKDLKNEQVQIIAPGNGLSTTINAHQFAWETVDGALEYTLQIVTPDFFQVERLLLDTTIANHKYTYTLSPGSYEWRVKAKNGSSETPYSTYQLLIDSTADLSGMPLALVSPNNAVITSQTEIEFRWQAIDIAEGYQLEITRDNGFNEVITDQEVLVPQLLVDMPEGAFNWRVYAFNATPSVSQWSEVRSLIIDLSPPSQPELNFPTQSDGVLSDTTLTFVFSSGVDELSMTYDSLWIASTNTFVNPIRKIRLESDGTYSDSLGSGTWYWRVKTIDEAGNGALSETASFEIE